MSIHSDKSFQTNNSKKRLLFVSSLQILSKNDCSYRRSGIYWKLFGDQTE